MDEILDCDEDNFDALAYVGSAAPAAENGRNWVNDLRTYGNSFYYETCFRLMGNACRNYKGPFFDADTFLPMARMMHPEKLEELISSCAPEKMRTYLMEMLGSANTKGRLPTGGGKEALRALWMEPRSHAAFAVAIRKWLLYAVEILKKWEKEKPDPARARFDEIVALFDLSDKERDLLVLASMVANRIWPSDELRGRIVGSKVIRVSSLLGISEAEYIDLVRSRGKLHRYGCLDSNGDLQEEIVPFINGIEDTPIVNRFFRKCTEEVLPWDYFGALGDKHGDFVRRLLNGRDRRRGLNILLYGEPGTGKTSFALALVKEIGATAYSIAHCFQNQRSVTVRNFRFAAVQICNSQVAEEESVILIDEADEMLEGGRGAALPLIGLEAPAGKDKGLLNEVLDTVTTPCIWLTNSPSSLLDPSNCRRFDYSIKFERLTHVQRVAIWGNARDKFGLAALLPDALVARLADRYEVSAGGISLAVQNLGALLNNKAVDEQDAEQVLGILLGAHCRLLHIDADAKAKAGVSGDYSLEGLNIKGAVKPAQIVEALRRFQAEQQQERTGGSDRPRMNILLSGQPGTGKTEFVKYLGGSLGMPVVTRMGSDLLDKYVGGTEKNIRKAFTQAAGERAILFLDEIDGLMQSRERAERSWEVTQVNELLHRMETFEGVLIGATNFANSLDPATLRRFTFKLEFDCLDDAGKELFFSRMFASFKLPELSAADEKHLRRIPQLTPGDFRTVRQGLYYLGENVTVQQLLDGLERESAMKAQGRLLNKIGY